MIIDLPAPKAQHDLDLHRVGTWEGDSVPSNSLRGRDYSESSLCSYAVAFGSFVFGVRQTTDEGEPWLSWKTSFAPFKVCRVTCNKDGSIIACTTDAGTVALIRGTDGSVLATRRVSTEEQGAFLSAAHASFVSRDAENQDHDALVVRIPSAKERTEFILVSNIDAARLNSQNPLQVADAARKMAIHNIAKLECEQNEIVSGCGCFLSQGRMRLFLLDTVDSITYQDFAGTVNNPLSSSRNTVAWAKDDVKRPNVDIAIGLRHHELNQDAVYVMFCAHQADGTTVYFLDPAELTIAGSFQLPKCTKNRVLEIQPLVSVELGLAVAVASRSTSGNFGVIHVMQTNLEHRKLHAFHQVYAIPIDETLASLSLASIRPSNGEFYSFRFKIWQGQDTDTFVCKAFVSIGHAIGRIRLSIEAGKFDEADSIINKIGENLLISENYAHFSPSEVALGRLQHLLRKGSISDRAAMIQAKQCFHRLSSGCISGNHKAGLNLVEASESLARWASPSSSTNPPGLIEVTTAIAAAAKTLGEVLKILPPERHEVFEKKKNELDDQLLTLKYLAKMLPEDSNERPHFAKQFQGSRDPGQLFANLVKNACFEAAERLWNSHLRPKIQPDIAVVAILGIGPDSDPKAYLGLLEHMVLPSLTIDYELLPSIWNWSCRLADQLDDSNEIDKAIWLLQSVERATNRLQLQIHRSFSSYSPFVNRPATSRKSKALQIKNSSSSEVSFNSACTTPAPQLCSGPPASSTNKGDFAFPTVLELTQMSKGAMKWSQKPVSKDVSTKDDLSGNGEETQDDQVRQKLLHAACLKASRELGLAISVTNLREFTDFGGTKRISTELVRHLSISSGNHDERNSALHHKLLPFCEFFGVDFDETLLRFVKSLCASTTASQESIVEAASVAQCCTNVSMKCQCILVVLRAALLCKYAPSWLSTLSREAVEWSALDLSLRSELVEASRLLSIDGIVRTYCGADSCDLFRVDNPRHALRLLDYVTQQFRRESVLHDALDLADAFTHLNRLDASVALCSHAIQGGCIDLCSDILEQIYRQDPFLADSTCIKVLSYCSELVNETSEERTFGLASFRIKKLNEGALNGSAAGCAIIPLMFALSCSVSRLSALSTNARVDVVRLESLKMDFLRINELQRNHSIYLSFYDLRNTTRLIQIAVSLMTPVVDAFMASDRKVWNIKLGRVRRACSLLAASCECQEAEFWCATISIVASPLRWKKDDERCLEFLHDVGVLGCLSSSNPVAARTVLSVAFGFCVKSASGARVGKITFNEDISRSVSLLQDYCVASCPDELVSHSQSLLTLSETVWRVLLRGDECVGETLESLRRTLLCRSWSSQFNPNNDKQGSTVLGSNGLLSLCRVPPLYTTWYIGDGLLLPPSESISRSIKFCKEMINTLAVSSLRRFVPLTSGGISEMSSFLFHRGALAVALRLLSCSSVLIMCSGIQSISYASIASSLQDVIAASVERSLGGTGSGIVSNIVDSQQAVSFLLSLNIKIAFKAFKSALPAAMATCDYSRVISLANIGIVAASGRRSGQNDGSTLNTGWEKQVKFIEQCRQYGNRAVWWRLLKSHRISFDHKKFEDDVKAVSYARTLIEPMITSLVHLLPEKRGSSVCGILHVLWRYADTFQFQRSSIVEAYVRYLLSLPDEGCSKDDIRFQLCHVEESVRELSLLLQPGANRAMMIRGCVVALEKDERSFKDYGRHALVLSLYREILLALRESHSKNAKKLSRHILESELELIERRRDALAILSSVFEKEKEGERPSFPSFFLPLPWDFAQYAKDVAVPSCEILGTNSIDKAFDPLESLRGFLLRPYENDVSTSLAPLCIPLGLPSGYIHARFLMDQFRLSLERGTSMPSFDCDVLPVFSRIQSSADKAVLAEWCSRHFVGEDSERLKFLELALNCAIKHSSEAEQRHLRSSNIDPGHAQEMMRALETVQRVSQAKSSLSDKMIVVAALEKDPSLVFITKQIVRKLEEKLWKRNDGFPTSDKVVEVLLAEASSLAANKCVANVPLSMRQFQKLSSLVNNACKELANEHSHIHLADITWSMAQSWLSQAGIHKVQNDNKSTGELRSPHSRFSSSKKPLLSVQTIREEEDTINFVMDLSAIHDDDQLWCEEPAKAPTGRLADIQNQNILPDEEQFALTLTEREEAEQLTTQIALRVAFVLSLHDLKEPDTTASDTTPPKARQATRGVGRHKAGGLLARIEQLGVKQNAYAMDCARHLLQVVFAKPESRCESKFSCDSDRNLSKTVTFAMRHRALRSAAVLVPQEALEQVIEDEGYLSSNGNTTNCTLSMCAFGVFVASESEAIGMPLSHSDLGNISAMHFSSYARTIWRHHRGGDLKGSRGRLFLLLLEMSLKDEENIDAAFVDLILNEMGRFNLPRTVLLACERIVALKEVFGFNRYESLILSCESTLETLITMSAKAVAEEMTRQASFVSTWEENVVLIAASTVYRMAHVLQHFSDSAQGQNRLQDFLKRVRETTRLVVGNEALKEVLEETLAFLNLYDVEAGEEG